MDTDNNLKGFTLIELVIVLSIFAILASAAVSAYVGIANKALKVQEDLTMNSLQKGALLYYAYNKRWWGINIPEDPFMLLENPPPHVLALSFPRVLNVDWGLQLDNATGIPATFRWIIFCPHLWPPLHNTGQGYDFIPVGAKYYNTYSSPH